MFFRWPICTLKKNDDDSKNAPDYDVLLSTLKLIHDNKINDWKIAYATNLMEKLKSILFNMNNQLNCFKCVDSLTKTSIAFLFHIDITMNRGVSMIHEGLKILGRYFKCSLLVHEFSRNGEQQYNVTQGEEQFKLVFGSNVHTRGYKKNRLLSASEYQNMKKNIEHDHMICYNYDRQSITLLASRDDKFYFIPLIMKRN